MAVKPKETIWTEKKIPPMEFMTIERAAKLLACDNGDIWHWYEIGAISLASRASGGDFAGWVKPKRVADRESVIEDLTIGQGSELSNISQKLSIRLESLRPTGTKKPTKDGRFEIKGVISGGLWLFSPDTSSGDIRKKEHIDALLYNHIRGKKADYMLFLEGSEKIKTDNSGLYLLRDDVERLYDSIALGAIPEKTGFFERLC